jgi:hypothetical protein
MVPIGFPVAAAGSRAGRRIAFLPGSGSRPEEKVVIRTAEEELAEEILRARGELALAEEFEAIAKGRGEPK